MEYKEMGQHNPKTKETDTRNRTMEDGSEVIRIQQIS